MHAQSSLTLCDPMGCSLLGSSIHGISQARILEWAAISFSRGSSPSRDGAHISYIAGGFFTTEPSGRPKEDVVIVHSFSRAQLFATQWLPCPSPSPSACSKSCPLSQWCHPVISFFVIPFSSCLKSFPASGSFLMSRLFASGGQSIGASASTLVLPMNIQIDFF